LVRSWDIDAERLRSAMELLGVEVPVYVEIYRRLPCCRPYLGCYRGWRVNGCTGWMMHSIRLRRASASIMNYTLWHELRHARQRERYPDDSAYWEAYHGDQFVPMELEARELPPWSILAAVASPIRRDAPAHREFAVLFSEESWNSPVGDGRHPCLVEREAQRRQLGSRRTDGYESPDERP